MEMMNQPFSGQLGARLIELLDSTDYHTLNIAVAFAKNSGVLRIKDALARFRARGGVVNAYVGVDMGGTSYEALSALLLNTDSLFVVHSERGQTFHSKIYQFSGEENGLLVVGSHNLTGGGLWTNFESSVHVHLDGADAGHVEILKQLSNYFKTLAGLGASFMPITNQDVIEKLLDEGYVTKEVAQRVQSAKTAKTGTVRERLFGNGASVALPRLRSLQKGRSAEHEATNEQEASKSAVPSQNETKTTEEEDANATIWFETREMTGGSRNILDLSKKCLLEIGDPTGTPFDLGDPQFMRGGVEFFGLSPTDTDRRADITINFDGKDYFGNTILYPDGSKANGTWRLQIKGENLEHEKITDTFRGLGEPHHLVRKVVTFTKVTDNYFYLSVFPETELEDFKDASNILARNGSSRNARYLGLL